MLVTLKLNPARAGLIGMFMNSYLRLNIDEQTVYTAAMKSLAPQEQKEVWSLEKATEEAYRGVERVLLITSVLSRRFGKVPIDVTKLVGEMSTGQAEELLEALFDTKAFGGYPAVKSWIRKTIA